MDDIHSKIDAMVKSDRIVLFMKGTKHLPMCGFSAKVVGILRAHEVPFTVVNVLADPAVREGVKAYGNWPTIPQLYVDGQLVGGCDIVSDLDAAGRLAAVLGAENRTTA